MRNMILNNANTVIHPDPHHSFNIGHVLSFSVLILHLRGRFFFLPFHVLIAAGADNRHDELAILCTASPRSRPPMRGLLDYPP